MQCFSKGSVQTEYIISGQAEQDGIHVGVCQDSEWHDAMLSWF